MTESVGHGPDLSLHKQTLGSLYLFSFSQVVASPTLSCNYSRERRQQMEPVSWNIDGTAEKQWALTDIPLIVCMELFVDG